MTNSTLEQVMAQVSAMWGPLTSELVQAARHHLETLAKASPDEPWLAALLHDQPASRELYRDPDHGFVLLAHTESAGLYRPPHDHGRAWVIYAVAQGESEMGTYGRAEGADGRVRLVKRNATLVRHGQAQVYLPGDVHDTLCLSGPALLFRFTERDLKVEDQVERRVTRYAQSGGHWTAAA
jgi:hypothetical protein